MLSGLTLAMDAAAGNGTIALLRDGRVVADADVVMRSERDERFFPAVLETLAGAGASLADVAQVVVGGGPGSFTALRVIGAIAKGIAQARGIPLYAIPSLALVAEPTGPAMPASQSAATSTPSRWLVTLDALRGERYAALVQRDAAGDVVSVEQLGVLPVVGLAERASALGATLLGPDEALRSQPHAKELARAITLVKSLGPVALATWEPSYGRLAEAQVKWEAAQGRPLR